MAIAARSRASVAVKRRRLSVPPETIEPHWMTNDAAMTTQLGPATPLLMPRINPDTHWWDL